MARTNTTPKGSAQASGKVESARSGMRRPAPGERAPVFALPDADMGVFDLEEVTRTHIVVLYFYPRDSMPSSLRLALEFSDAAEALRQSAVIPVGISLDDCLVHGEFCDRHGLDVTLLSDTDATVCRLYGVWQERQMGGMMKPDVQRTIFIIGRDGLVHHVLDDWSLGGQAAKILEIVQKLARSTHGNRQEHRRHP